MTEDPLVIFTPSGKRARVPAGTTVLAAARRIGVDLDSVCGGRGICSKCQVSPQFGQHSKHGVTVHDDALSEWNSVEARYDEKRGLRQGRRLGCQAEIRGDVVLDVPPESQVHRQVVRKAATVRDIRMDPATRLFYVEVAEPDMHEPSGDLERLNRALKEQWDVGPVEAPLPLLRKLQPVLRKGAFRVTVAVHQPHRGPVRLIDIWPGLYEGGLYGLAIDLGSTTIAAHLCDLDTGAVLASAGLMNPQIRFGEDLMSRVSYVMMNPEGREAMTRAVREAINGLIGKVCEQGEIDRQDILDSVFVGNPIMHHLFLGIDPTELGGAPFALALSGAICLPSSDIGIDLNPGARTYMLPCIAGHVGADAAAVTLSEGPHRQDEMMLIVDVGTNAEIVLGNWSRCVAASSPTGPAFEGAEISCGQRAAPGAIERVRIDPETLEPRYRVIGIEQWSDEPGFAEASQKLGVSGVCGSGIIEVVAEMYLAGIISEDGVIDGSLAEKNPRIVAEGRTFSYVLKETAPRLTITQNDIRAIQLAKAALYAGIKLLMDKQGIAQVDRIGFAGAFGSFIDPKYAMVLGLIPDCDLDKVKAVGNAAGAGARMALLNRNHRREIEDTVRRIEKIETALEPKFQDHFVSAMALPNKRDAFPNLASVVTLPARQADQPERDIEGGEGPRRRGGRRGRR